MQFAIDKVGQWSDEQEFKVEAERIKQYAEATNDPIPQHVNGELAPPVFAVVPVWDAMGGPSAKSRRRRRSRSSSTASRTCTSTSRSSPAWCCARVQRPSAST